jgi:hypothetical protein
MLSKDAGMEANQVLDRLGGPTSSAKPKITAGFGLERRHRSLRVGRRAAV